MTELGLNIQPTQAIWGWVSFERVEDSGVLGGEDLGLVVCTLKTYSYASWSLGPILPVYLKLFCFACL